MSFRIVSPSVSLEALAVRDRQARRDKDGRKAAAAEAETTAPLATRASPRPDSVSDNEATPIDSGLSSETLFAAALIANDLPARPASAEEVSLQARQDWSPPSSPLHLRDKTI